jgi:formate hydrogenlyase subunit 3/multisubunit Na+/H+ antiporter MnhD subunit
VARSSPAIAGSIAGPPAIAGVATAIVIAKSNARMNGVPVFSLYVIIIFLLCAIVNYGSGRYEWMLPKDKADPQRTKRLPGRPLMWTAPAIGALAALVLPWATALAVFRSVRRLARPVMGPRLPARARRPDRSCAASA